VKHLLKSPPVDTVCYSETSVLLLRLGNDVEIGLVSVNDEPVDVHKAVKKKNQRSQHKEEHSVTKPVRCTLGSMSLRVLNDHCKLVSNCLYVADGQYQELVSCKDNKDDQHNREEVKMQDGLIVSWVLDT